MSGRNPLLRALTGAAVLFLVLFLLSDGDGVLPFTALARPPARSHPARSLCRSMDSVSASLRAAVASIEGDACTGPTGSRKCDPTFLWKTHPPQWPAMTPAQEAAFSAPMVTPPTPLVDAGGAAQWYGGALIDFAISTTFFVGDARGVGTAPWLNGVYLEAGASNGVHASNTLFFERALHWTGLLLEPTTCALCEVPANRPRSTSLYGAICAKEAMFNASDLTHFCRLEGVPECPAAESYKAASATPTLVRCAPLSAWVSGAGVRHIDFLSLDAEQHTFAALQSFDWDRVTVSVMTVECSEPECATFLRDKGFLVIEAKDTPLVDNGGNRVDLVAWRNAPGCVP